MTGSGSVRFATTSRALAEGFRELVVSLGYRCGTAVKPVKGGSEESSTCYVTTFTTDDDVFRLERKRLMHKERRRPPTPRLTRPSECSCSRAPIPTTSSRMST